MSSEERRRLTEIERRVSQSAAVGVIEEADYKLGRYRVRIGEIVTDFLPVAQLMAGKNRTWSPLDLGEQVFVASAASELTQGVILGSLPSDNSPRLSDDPNLVVTKYEDGTVITHNRKTKSTSISAPSGGTIDLSVGGARFQMNESKLTLSVDEFEVNARMTVKGSELLHNGKNVGSTHVHGGIVKGPRNTQGPQ
ncbi:phage baseplate assembly protein V [Pseudovibrio ascidiaceicola]|uniref:phage baseplate assembly protein V n=1 Tax=Pseudovibrio ascidiaceicola TaxID=285279 RepID=UPI003D36BD15